MKVTRTGIAKGTCWVLYQEAQAASYTPTNIKNAWHATGIFLYNHGAVLSQLPGYNASRVVPKVSTNPRAFKRLQTTVNH